jgi:hypothetical protein
LGHLQYWSSWETVQESHETRRIYGNAHKFTVLHAYGLQGAFQGGQRMIVHIDKLIRHLRSQIESADKVDSEFVYLTKREAEGCLELAEAQDVIQEMFDEKSRIVRCKDCIYYNHVPDSQGDYCDRIHWSRGLNWFCADGKRKG